jgi:ABC-2 type transport system permease protein
MHSFFELTKANLRIVYRDTSALFWTIVLPVMLYIALSLMPVEKLFSTSISYRDYILPGIITYVIMQGGIYGLAYALVDLKSRGALKRFMVTPIKTWQLVLSMVVARLMVILVQVLLLSFIGIVLFNVPFAGNIGSIILLTVLGGCIFLLVGLLISNYADTYATAAPITGAIGLPLSFLGDIFIPLSIMPGSVQTAGKLLPVTYLAEGLRHAYLSPLDPSLIAKDTIVLLSWLAVLLIATISVFRLKE